MNSTQHSSIYGWNGSTWERVEVNSGNQLQVEVKNTTPISVTGSFTADISGQSVVVSNNTDPATATLQTSGNASLTSLDGKVTACDTGNVSGEVVVSNITTCDTGNVSGSVSVSNNTDPATATLQTAGNSSLTAIQGSHYIEGGSIGVSDTGVLIMGRNGTNAAKPIHITNNGDVEVEIADFVKGQAVMALSFPVVLASDNVVQTAAADVNNKGSYGNVANNVTINAGIESGSADVSDMNNVTILYTDTATTSYDPVSLLASGDGVNYDIVTILYPNTNTAGTLRYANYQGSLGGLTDIKIQNESSTENYTNVKCSVWGSPN